MKSMLRFCHITAGRHTFHRNVGLRPAYHPSMYFTEPSSYLEDTYFGKFSSYLKHRFKDEDELYITAVAMIAGILRLDGAGFTKNRDVTV